MLISTTNPIAHHHHLNHHHGQELFHHQIQNPQSSPPLFPFSLQNQNQDHLKQQQLNFQIPPLNIQNLSQTQWATPQNPNPNSNQNPIRIKAETVGLPIPPPPLYFQEQPPPTFTHKHLVTPPNGVIMTSSAHLSATALLQKAAAVGAKPVGHAAPTTMAKLDAGSQPEYFGFPSGNVAAWQRNDRLTRDFLGLTGGGCANGNADVSVNRRDLLAFTEGVEFPAYDSPDHSLLKAQAFDFAEPPPASETWG